ncbi:MAG TPA: nucleotidyltransferase family protein [Pyrinomonadaceae bacterium]|nr:nucleotidyltransferase family protein [Pyrinomonadaceae bacterium]
MTQTQQPEEISTAAPDRWGLIKNKATEARACLAFKLFREKGIEPILIKGLAAAQFYPNGQFRDSIDMDIAVSDSDFAIAKKVVESEDANGLAIDLHRELRHLDTVHWTDLFANSQVLSFDCGTIRVLRPEDHLRVLCVHWLTDGASNKERLWDICNAVANRPTDFDWDRFLNVVDHKRRRWLISTIGLAHRYLGLDLAGTPVELEANSIPAWLIKTVEKEWATDKPFWPLFSSLHDPKLFFAQIKKRLPPNPATATVLLNGSFDAKTRIFYQIGTIFVRIGPSIVNVTKALFTRPK